MMLLKNAKDIDALLDAVKKCNGDVILRSIDGKEEFNLKSTISRWVGVARMCEEAGDQYEIFCMDRNDTGYMMQFFYNIKDSIECA